MYNFVMFVVPENKELSQSIIRHLRWIAQKDLLGQDVFLIGPPGPLRRQIAMLYLVSVSDPVITYCLTT